MATTSPPPQAPKTTSSTPKLSEAARHLVLPAGIVSTGWPAVRDTCANLGVRFDPWQDGAGRAILGKGPDGLYAADAAVMSIPRQVGKTYLIGWLCFALCLIFPNLTILWTAHRYKTATETFQSMKGMARRALVRPHILKVTQGAGDQVIYFRNGSRVLFGARERGFGRGFAGVDVEVFDEAQILTEAAIDDMIPATNVSPNPLILYIGTPPKPDDPGEVFSRHRAEALAGKSTDELYIEFSADAGADPMDREQWRKANPSYPGRTTERAMLRMWKNLTPEAFVREGLGIWDESDEAGVAIPLAWWRDRVDEGSRLVGRPVFAVDVSPDRSRSTVVACGLNADGVPHLEVIDTHPGTGWCRDRLVELMRDHNGRAVVRDNGGPAGTLDLDGVDNLLDSGAAGLVQSCGRLYDGARDGGFVHLGDPILENALTSAATRVLGDRWAWKRRTSSSDITPIVAAGLALWAHSEVADLAGLTAFRL